MSEKRKVSVLLEPAEFSRFERYCEAHGYKKSTLIVRLIREHLNREGHHDKQKRIPFDEADQEYGQTNVGEVQN